MAKRRGKRRGGLIGPLLALGAVLLAVSAMIAPSWAGELAASWQPHLVAIGILAALWALLARRRVLAVLLVVGSLVLLGGVFVGGLGSAQSMADHEATDRPTALRVVWANIEHGNDDLGAFGAWVAEQDPDVVIVTEVTPSHIAALDALLAGWPHRILEPRDHAFGMALYSRRALVERRVVPLDSGVAALSGPVAVVARVATPSGMIGLVGLHPFPPTAPSHALRRDSQLQWAAELVLGLDGPTAVAGDFNATPWSPALRRFMDTAEVDGVNLAATWPAPLGFAGIPIDHVLVDQDLGIAAIESGPSIGSDHRPLVVDLVRLDQGSPGTP